MSSPGKAQHYWGLGARLPLLQETMVGVDTPSLAGATATFRLRDETGTEADGAGTVTLDANALTLTYAPVLGDTAAAGYLRGRFKVTFASGKIGWFPSVRWIRILVSN